MACPECAKLLDWMSRVLGPLPNLTDEKVAALQAEGEALLLAQGMPLEEPRREGGSGASAPASPVGNADAPSPSPKEEL